jgi:YD repeat-containing protein
MLIRILFSLLFLLTATIPAAYVSAQQPEQHPLYEQVIPPSPEVARLAQVAEIPVSLNTGKPNISIPIWTIRGRDLSLPISLSYDAGGAKVDDMASWVGLGWTLNAAPAIARVTRGFADEISGVGYFDKYGEWDSGPGRGLMYQEVDGEFFLADPKYIFMQKAAQGHFDLQPDVFHINVGGYSAKLVFDVRGGEPEPVLYPYADLRIIVNRKSFNSTLHDEGWEIVTPMGVRYIFNNRDAEVARDSYGNIFITAWHLSQIVNANGTERISFGYMNGESGVSEPIYHTISSTVLNKKQTSYQEQCYTPPSSSKHSEIGYQKTQTLSTIAFRDLRIRFIRMDDRNMDNDPSRSPRLYRLSRIEVSDTHSGLLKRFALHHSYPGPDKNNLRKGERRLQLDSLSQSGMPSYVFTYYWGPNNADFLPSYYSHAKDHWGYYNGMANDNLIPPVDPEYLYTYHNSPLASADRETREFFMKLGVLTAIRYPAGGTVSLEYEPNMYTLADTMDNYQMIEDLYVRAVGADDRPLRLEEQQYKDLFTRTYIDHQYCYGGPDDIVVRVSPAFVVESQGQARFTSSMTGTDAPCSPFGVYVFKSNASTFEDGVHVSTFTGERQIFLQPGVYRLVAILNQPQFSITTTGYYIHYRDDHFVDIRRQVGGLRVKRIIRTDDRPGAQPIVMDYHYEKNYMDHLGADPSDPYQRQSSLQLFYEPEYMKILQCGNILLSAYEVDAFGRFDGYHCGYDEVTVAYDGGRGGYVNHRFVNSKNPEWRNQPLYERYYNANTELLKEVAYRYSHMDGDYTFVVHVPTHRIVANRTVRVASIINMGDMFRTYFDDLHRGVGGAFTYLAETLTRTFPEGGSDKYLETMARYHYDGAEAEKHALMTRTEQYTSTGDTLVSEMKYPPDMSKGAPGAYSDMVDRNLIALPVETVTRRNAAPVAGQRTHFDLFDDQIQPAVVYQGVPNQTDKGASLHYEPAIRYLEFDGDGNLLSYTTRTGVVTSLLWGYGNNQVVAKIENAAYDDIRRQVGQPVLDRIRSSYDAGAIEADIGALRQGLPKGVVTTYLHAPGIGIEEIVDPSGVATKYAYDKFHRLQTVRDHEEDIVQHYGYHYKRATE